MRPRSCRPSRRPWWATPVVQRSRLHPPGSTSTPRTAAVRVTTPPVALLRTPSASSRSGVTAPSRRSSGSRPRGSVPATSGSTRPASGCTSPTRSRTPSWASASTVPAGSCAPWAWSRPPGHPRRSSGARRRPRSEREGPVLRHGLHDEGGGEALDTRQRGELLVVDLLEGREILRDHAKEVVGLAEESLRLEHVCDAADGLLEGRHRRAVCSLHGDEHEGLEAQSKRGRVQV